MVDIKLRNLCDETKTRFKGVSTPKYEYYGDDITARIVVGVHNSASNLINYLEKVVIHYANRGTSNELSNEIRKRLELINARFDDRFEILRENIRTSLVRTGLINDVMEVLASSVLEIEKITEDIEDDRNVELFETTTSPE